MQKQGAGHEVRAVGSQRAVLVSGRLSLEQMTLLQLENVCVSFKGIGRSARLRAVAGVSLGLRKGECLGLVGESGCGKTTLANAVVGLVPVTSGSICFLGRDVVGLNRRDLKGFRRQVQMVFQDPFGSLNPRMSAGECIAEALGVHGGWRRAQNEEGGNGSAGIGRGRKGERDRCVEELLELVGLDREYASCYPHEFSGGQRQRLGIARALAVRPSVMIADEPVSALDVSVQVQILNLMKDLQERADISYLFIAHDLAVVRYMCDRVLVMYLGKIVESSRTEELFARTAHPYTEALLSAMPNLKAGLGLRKGGRCGIVLRGDVPSPLAVPSGCPFHTRCHRAQGICRITPPSRTEVSEDHYSTCHFAREVVETGK